MKKFNISFDYWRYRLWLLAILWLPLQVMAIAPKLSVESFSIVSGGTKTVPILLDNPDNALTLLQFDMQLPEGLTLKPTTSGDYEMNMAGRTMWRNHSLVANQLTDGSYRVLLCSNTNTLIEGNKGAILTLTFQATDDFKDGQMVLNNILMVSPEGHESKQDKCECTVKALPKPTMGTATISCQPLSVNVGEEAELTVSLNNPNEDITLVQFDMELPQGLTIKNNEGNLSISIAGRTTEKEHTLQAVLLADGHVRILLKSDKNSIFLGNSGPIISITMNAAKEFTGGMLIFSNILLVGPNEQESTQAPFQLLVNAIIPDPTLATSISLGLTKSKLYLGEKLQATYRLLPEDVTNKMVAWKSSNTEVATITAYGLIEAVGPGKTMISVSTTDGTELSDSTLLTVEVQATQITLNLSKTTINAGEQLQATYTLLPDNVSSNVVEWESSNTNVATINDAGLIKAISPGVTIITVKTTDGSQLSDSVQITVNRLGTGITIGLTKSKLYVGEKLQATYSLQPEDVTNKTVSWKSSNTEVATITAYGLIEAVGPGKTMISVSTTDGTELSDSTLLTVEVQATQITLNLSKTTINAGEQLQATYTLLPDNVSSNVVEWGSSNTNVATINDAGLIKAVSPGVTIITVKTTDGSQLSDSVQITVNRLGTGITIGLTKSKLYVGEKLQATYSLQPEDVTNKTVLWKSSNTKVATITMDGLIEAVGPGTTMISVSTTDGTELSDSTLLTVEQLATKIMLSLSKTTINAGEQLQASYTILPDNVSSNAVKWESSNTEVVTISDTGLITAVGLGTSVISVRTTDGSKLSDSKQITVNEKVIDITDNLIGYRLYSWQKKATVIKITANQQDDLVIPEHIDKDNINYQVTAIADSAFTEDNNNEFCYLSITIPASINFIGNKAFDSVHALSIIYHGEAKLTSHQIEEMRRLSKNALLYVNNTQVLPTEELDNVVVDGTAQNVIFTEYNEFHCPKQFTAKKVSFTHHFMMETGIKEAAGWETIVLPFDVETISHESKGNLIPFSAYNGGLENYMPFWLFELSTNGFIKANAIEANKPYLISMPNNSNYTADYNLNGKVTFSAVNASIKTTKANDITQQTKSHEGKTFAPLYRFMEKEEGGYAINAITEFSVNTGGKTAGSVFIKGLRRIAPFEGYFSYENINASLIIDIPFANEFTDIVNVPVRPEKVNVYALSGQFVGTFTYNDLTKPSNILPVGIYIVNGKKMIVK